MSQPIAFKLTTGQAFPVHAISLDKAVAARLTARASTITPAVLAVTNVAMLPEISAGIFDDDDVQVLVPGDWSRAILVVLPAQVASANNGEEPDADFFDWVKREAPDLSDLAHELVQAIRNKGIEGSLQLEGQRWVNRPLNTFTLAVQKRVKNFQFTLYGGPERFGKSDFLKSDQNGYSRGWVKSRSDIGTFVALASIADERKRRR